VTPQRRHPIPRARTRRAARFPIRIPEPGRPLRPCSCRSRVLVYKKNPPAMIYRHAVLVDTTFFHTPLGAPGLRAGPACPFRPVLSRWHRVADHDHVNSAANELRNSHGHENNFENGAPYPRAPAPARVAPPRSPPATGVNGTGCGQHAPSRHTGLWGTGGPVGRSPGGSTAPAQARLAAQRACRSAYSPVPPVSSAHASAATAIECG
jgi:hypothetical protein